jgi:hypothetical protein
LIAPPKNRMHGVRYEGDTLNEGLTQKNGAETPEMHQVFIEGGLIRNLWSVDAYAYRDHLLRLDAESRRNRFCGGIADETIRS